MGKYVLIDESDEGVIMAYDNKNEAIKDAKELQNKHRLSSYIICECIGNKYDVEYYVFKSSELSGKF